MTDLMSHVGPRLRLARERRGLSLKEVAEQTGAYISNLSCYESGKRTPALPLFVDLARVLGVSTDYLLGIDEEYTAAGELQEIVANLLQLPSGERRLLADVIRLVVRPSRGELPAESGAAG